MNSPVYIRADGVAEYFESIFSSKNQKQKQKQKQTKQKTKQNKTKTKQNTTKQNKTKQNKTKQNKNKTKQKTPQNTSDIISLASNITSLDVHLSFPFAY